MDGFDTNLGIFNRPILAAEFVTMLEDEEGEEAVESEVESAIELEFTLCVSYNTIGF